jgi:hypothetical protein
MNQTVTFARAALLTFSVLSILGLFGCSKKNPAESNFGTEEIALPSPSENVGMSPVNEDSANVQQEQRAFQGSVSTQKIANTGVKADILLAILNSQMGPDDVYQHNFQFVQKDGDSSYYRDTENSLLLLLMEPKDDLMLIELVMPLKEFIGEREDGTISGEGAAAFGRCVQRLGLAIDPSWSADLYEWMNEKMKYALIMPDGAQLRYKHLLISFDTNDSPDNVKTINLAIGVEEK